VPAAANPGRLRFISVYLPWLSQVRRAASRLRTPAKPAVASRYAAPFAGLSWRVPTLGRIPSIRSTTSAPEVGALVHQGGSVEIKVVP
jgi:hypothetical protein